ncbi:MAG TPA: hypothetical protein VFT82_01665 [Candidatus Paceibacterota bacterium]|nr:hypothetical protein [Candidatus Paceibacterota bacterium]
MKSTANSTSRLLLAGSEHSEETQRLREATDGLLVWIRDNIPESFQLPCNCELLRASSGYPKGLFLRHPRNRPGVQAIRLEIGTDHPRLQLSLFSELVAEGFLDRLSDALTAEAKKFRNVTRTINAFQKHSKR